MGFVLGVDIAKKKFDVALLMNEKVRHRVFGNSQDGFSELATWLKKHATIDRLHVCMEASSTYGEDLATYLHDQGHTVSIVIRQGSRGSRKVSCCDSRTTKSTPAS